MGKPAELRDDVAMLYRIFGRVLVAQRLEEIDTPFLLGEDLRMHEGHVEELLLVRRHVAVKSLQHRVPRNSDGQVVGAEGIGAFAEHVARKLIVDDDRRERFPAVRE